jgi:hypothetical protein
MRTILNLLSVSGGNAHIVQEVRPDSRSLTLNRAKACGYLNAIRVLPLFSLFLLFVRLKDADSLLLLLYQRPPRGPE